MQNTVTIMKIMFTSAALTIPGQNKKENKSEQNSHPTGLNYFNLVMMWNMKKAAFQLISSEYVWLKVGPRLLIIRQLPSQTAFSSLESAVCTRGFHLYIFNFFLTIYQVTKMENLVVGFIGAGKMAQALAGGFVSAGLIQPNNIWMSAPSDKNLLLVKDKGYNTTRSNFDVVEKSSVIFLAMKPAHLSASIDDRIKRMSKEDKSSRLIVSVVTGTTLLRLIHILGGDFSIVRIVTNTGVQVRAGVTVYAKNDLVTENQAELMNRLMLGVGACYEAPEHNFNAVTGCAGSGPAYIYLIIQAIADGAVKMGIPRPLALNLATQTCLGASKMVIETGKHPGELQDEICSPGGTTIHGLHKLESSGVRGAIMSAVEAATRRADDFTESLF
ncbi:Pyrroline-5-carboxylate reductase 1, mitochondrial [Chamberlinius hualienensis]